MIQRRFTKKIAKTNSKAIPVSTHSQNKGASFLKFVATSVLTRVSSDHPDLGGKSVQLQLRHVPGHDCNHFVMSASSADGKRLGEYEAQGSEFVQTLRKIYRAPEDSDNLKEALKSAEAMWPSKNDFHRCSKCWGYRIAIAIRLALDSDCLEDWIIYTGKGCGSVQGALNEINDKVHFLQSLGVDAFPVWVDEQVESSQATAE